MLKIVQFKKCIGGYATQELPGRYDAMPYEALKDCYAAAPGTSFIVFFADQKISPMLSEAEKQRLASKNAEPGG